MKIAYLSSEYPAISHTFIFWEVRALREQGFKVFTASINRPKNLEKMTDSEKQDAENTFYIKNSFRRMLGDTLALAVLYPMRFFRMLSAAWKLHFEGNRQWIKTLAYLVEAILLLKWMLRNNVRHVHVHFANPAATVAMLAAESSLAEFSISIHGPDVFYRVDSGLLKQKVDRAAFIRCISFFCKSQVARLLPPGQWSKLHIIRCGVEPDSFTPAPQSNNGKNEILCLGRLCPAKAQGVLIEAIHLIQKQGKNYRVTFVGGGESKKELEQRVAELGLQEKITFTGAVGQAKVHHYYDRADLFVLPSFAEGVPVVLMEAMAKEIPVISTRVMGIPELIEHERDGLLVPPANPQALAEAIQRLTGNASLRQQLGHHARQKIIEQYNLTSNCRKMASIFRTEVFRQD